MKPSYPDFEHTGPGTLAGRYLRSFWQPIYHAKELLPGRAVPVKVMGQQLTLYRGEGGTPHLVGFRCLHRKAQLSIGTIEGDDIRCFYHGWKYDPHGRCVHQPAEPRPFLDKVRIESYPVREYLDLIFAYLGEGEPPEMPRYPDFEDFEGILEYASYFRACNYFNNVENFLDVAHLGFVHKDHVGGFDGRYDSPTLDVSETIWGATCKHARPSGKKGQTQFGMPNLLHLKGFTVAPEIVGHREVIGWWVPVDDHSHHRFAISSVRMKEADIARYLKYRDANLAKRTVPNAMLAEQIVAGQLAFADVDKETTDYPHLVDDVAQISQGRIHDRSEEMLGASDVGVALIRRLWARELAAFEAGGPTKAWRYDPQLETAKL
jgi:5,5'-dehydrodivanillate O-demethylase